MSIAIIIRFDDHTEGHLRMAEFIGRFGTDRVVMQWVDESESDEVDEDEVDEDMLLTILHGASQRLGDRPEARQLGELIHALQAPPAQRREQLTHPTRDEAPPRGMPRPHVAPFAKPNATQKRFGNSRDRIQAIDFIVQNTACPTCGAGRFKMCGSPRHKGGDSYGHHHVHQARINLLAWQED